MSWMASMACRSAIMFVWGIFPTRKSSPIRCRPCCVFLMPIRLRTRQSRWYSIKDQLHFITRSLPISPVWAGSRPYTGIRRRRSLCTKSARLSAPRASAQFGAGEVPKRRVCPPTCRPVVVLGKWATMSMLFTATSTNLSWKASAVACAIVVFLLPT